MAQNAGAAEQVEHWLTEQMKLWHTLPAFLLLAAAGVTIVQTAQMAGVPLGYTNAHAIASAGLFTGVAMGWHWRRLIE